MLPVYLKIFDEKLLFAQGTANASQSIPLYTIFTGQAALYFCLILGDERKRSWYRIVHRAGRNEDEPFAEISVSCRDGVPAVALVPGNGTLELAEDINAEFSRMYGEGNYTGILGIARDCKDPAVFEQACETQKLIFSDDKDIQAICDNAEHRLVEKYRPRPPPAPRPVRPAREPAAGTDVEFSFEQAISRITRAIAYTSVVLLILLAVICTLIMVYLYWVGGRPVIEIIR